MDLRVVTCIALASLLMGEGAIAQAFPPAIELPPDLPTVMPAPTGGYPPTVAPTAAGSYLAPSAWSQTLAPNVRFVILSNFSSDAVLDRETGLVWSRRTVNELSAVVGATSACSSLVIGNRMGWRLPTIAELQSLVDPAVPITLSVPRLPAGHPFLLSSQSALFPYLTAETLFFANGATNQVFRWVVNLALGGAAATPTTTTERYGVLCVRGDDASRTQQTP